MSLLGGLGLVGDRLEGEGEVGQGGLRQVVGLLQRDR